MVGRALKQAFLREGHEVWCFVRPGTRIDGGENQIFWDYAAQKIELEKCEKFDAVIHLAGVNIADQRWSTEYKEIILESRVLGTRFLCQSLSQLKYPPKVLISASAVGFYGNHSPEQHIDEVSAAGFDFLADVCKQWEQVTQIAQEVGTRVVNLRIGMILSPEGGALKKMLPIFKLGLGGNIGSGRQAMSWIALEEFAPLAAFLINRESIQGPVNCVAPGIVTNQEFTKILGKVLKRPVVFPLPEFAVKLMFGEMGESLLLGGVRALPNKLLDAGYQFCCPDLETTLESMFRGQR